MSSPHRDDQETLVEELLAELSGPERDGVDSWSELGEEERRRLERLDIELLGMLPRSLPPRRPREAAREELVAAAVAPGAASQRMGGESGRRWILPLAASLAALALGLSGYLAGRAHQQRQVLAGLEAEVNELRARNTLLTEGERQVREQLAVVGSPGVEACPLRPRQASPLGGEPLGVLYVAADHQHWYLALHGLAPCPQGRVYQVWFLAGDGAVSAGTVRPEPGTPIELSSASMPAGTWAVRVTLEPAGGAASPSGPEILYGDEPAMVL